MKYQRALLLNTFLFLTLATHVAFAGMTISGTRVIFPGSEKEQTIRTNNKNKTPSLVQVWVDDGNKNSDINNIKVPFTATPPVYRVEPGKGQSVRLIYNGMALPQDRESVFWFNMLEIPPMNEKAKETDHLELAFRTRIKIFYRPTTLKSSSASEFEKLQWEMISPTKGIKVINPTPYYFSFDAAVANSGSGKYPLVVDMVPPFGSKEFLLERKNNMPATINSVDVRLINDYGSVINYLLVNSSGNTFSIKK
ncbi:pilus assembly protein [Enterobacter cloacae subsp. cloacae]|uniref:fimbrial biogenesis chaperone n=1 Tax=Enterobacter cloacae TaxID=550 RepID=UPI00063AC610|nr:fimbria/pilus periplasmic chaperone [Enterobacter cloacae]KLG05262.1 pilus assembly protein [Enterobacter cloacae subsp. cloacae]